MTIHESSFAPDRSGVYAIGGDTASVKAAATRAGLAWLSVDLSAVRDKTSLLNALARDLAFPASFGQNWDALADALQDFSWQPARGYIIELRHAQACAAASPGDWPIVLDMLRETAAYWRERGKSFIALIRDAGNLPPFGA
jgi:RNAse (barnase) inhibitor barstar